MKSLTETRLEVMFLNPFFFSPLFFISSKGRKRGNRGKKNAFSEENRASEEPMLSGLDRHSLQQAERRLGKEGIHSLKKVKAQMFSH